MSKIKFKGKGKPIFGKINGIAFTILSFLYIIILPIAFLEPILSRPLEDIHDKPGIREIEIAFILLFGVCLIYLITKFIFWKSKAKNGKSNPNSAKK
ncbi:MAG: hypothetical protein AAF705_01865, partial [Bacteroidota bacterium]